MPNLSPHHKARQFKSHKTKNDSWGRGRGGRPWRRKREKIFKRDRYLCQLHLNMGKYIAVDLHGPNAGVLDHKVPLSQGGSDDESNLWTICKQCDKVKTVMESRGGGIKSLEN